MGKFSLCLYCQSKQKFKNDFFFFLPDWHPGYWWYEQNGTTFLLSYFIYVVHLILCFIVYFVLYFISFDCLVSHNPVMVGWHFFHFFFEYTYCLSVYVKIGMPVRCCFPAHIFMKKLIMILSNTTCYGFVPSCVN